MCAGDEAQGRAPPKEQEKFAVDWQFPLLIVLTGHAEEGRQIQRDGGQQRKCQYKTYQMNDTSPCFLLLLLNEAHIASSRWGWVTGRRREWSLR
jgi:hypothetical protein